MRHILVVFLADVFHEFVSGLKSGGEGQLEWSGVCTRIVDRDFVDQSSKILSGPTFNRVQFCRVGMAPEIEPEPVVKSDSVDDEGVAFIMCDRVAVPSRIEIVRMFSLVQKDLAVAVDISFKEKEDVGRRLEDSPGVGRYARYTGRQAICLRVILGLPGLHEFFCFRQERNGFPFGQAHSQILYRTTASPESGQVGLSVGEMGSRSLWRWNHPLLPSLGLGRQRH